VYNYHILPELPGYLVSDRRILVDPRRLIPAALEIFPCN
jgi:hypothetical protein